MKTQDIPLPRNYSTAQEWQEALVYWLGNFLFRNDADLRSSVPPGVVVEWSAAAAPDGWLLCDGATYSASRYPYLSKVLGTDPFTVPNSAGKIIKHD